MHSNLLKEFTLLEYLSILIFVSVTSMILNLFYRQYLFYFLLKNKTNETDHLTFFFDN